MKVTDVAVYLKIHRNTVYRSAKGGNLPVGSRMRFRRSDIDQVIGQVTDLGQQKADHSSEAVRRREPRGILTQLDTHLG
jgi:excisionase family DNA binding protein